MIDRIELVYRRWRRRLSRSEIGATLLGLPRSQGTASDPGLVMIQIDGLSYRQLTRALEAGEMPYLATLLTREGHVLRPLYSGLPASTAAFQAELFYGEKGAVPAFSYRRRGTGETVRMFEPTAAATVERELREAGFEPLLAGGSSYSNIFTGGADEAHFCPSALGWGPELRSAGLVSVTLVVVVNLYSFARVLALLGLEAILALGDGVRGTLRGKGLWQELKFIPIRVGVSVLLRELITIGAKIDVARGLPIVHLNLLGYDEQAHRRGPSSRFAHWTLKGIDDAIGRIARAAALSARRHYDVWIYSDHGQEDATPYAERHGESLEDAVRRLLDAWDASGARAASSVQLERARWLGGPFGRWPGFDAREETTSGCAVAALGPIAMIYPARDLSQAACADIARALVERAGVPVVLYTDGHDGVRGHRPQGTFVLPADAAAVFTDHPYPDTLAEDLARVCRHPDAGRLVACGWQADDPLTFAEENGAHGGIGPEETRPFVLVPHDTPLPEPATGRGAAEPLRATHLREAALHFLARRHSARTETAIRERGPPPTLRVVTYNVHACIGMDGRLSPERIARVIARLDPDVVALQELDAGRPRSGSVDQAHRIAELLEMTFHFHPTVHVAEERYGDAILSRLPMELVRAQGLPGLPRREPRGALWVRIHTAVGPIQVLNTHLGLSAAERRLQAEALLGPEWLGHPQCAEPRILCGDLNALPWTRTYRRLTEHLVDVQGALPGHRPARTFFGRLPSMRIDHILVGPDITPIDVEVPSGQLARVASDHLPLVAELRLPERVPRPDTARASRSTATGNRASAAIAPPSGDDVAVD